MLDEGSPKMVIYIYTCIYQIKKKNINRVHIGLPQNG